MIKEGGGGKRKEEEEEGGGRGHHNVDEPIEGKGSKRELPEEAHG
jgi:hypothetical protein